MIQTPGRPGTSGGSGPLFFLQPYADTIARLRWRCSSEYVKNTHRVMKSHIVCPSLHRWESSLRYA
ncbi:hypothetical protein MMALV_05050 [Candidatus Methanomethylophilus alvi Mx1201]|uniref:Uncharacterized protein n=1 Tax=Methanomethylophilus alvi (strain Mx1201) TaxID=1236689 RepID=M9SI58_METAX|nr:hypothetical protein MMALV_05050 [Candidatus Methanomethylophilus alvi Mx1201]